MKDLIFSLSSSVHWGAFSFGFKIAKLNPLGTASSKKIWWNAALNTLFPLKANDRLLNPPTTPQPFKFSRI